MSDEIFEFRKTDNSKFYAPDRDLIHATAPILKSALGLTLDSFEEEELPGEEFDQLVSAIALVRRKAMLKDAPEDIVAELFKAMEAQKPEVVGLFVCNFFRCFMLKYIEALRNCVQAPDLTESEIASSISSLFVMSVLPLEDKDRVQRLLRASGFLKPSYAAATSMYERIRKEKEDLADDADNSDR